jgi:hypothetical protein
MRKLLVTIMALLAVSVMVVATQQAKVIHLKTEDQATAKKLYAELQAAQKAWDQFNTKISERYTQGVGRNALDLCSGGKQGCYKPGFHFGFEFSEDFSVIVPKPAGTGSILWKSSSNTPYPYSFPSGDGCNTTTCTAAGFCTSTLLGCIPKGSSVLVSPGR